MTSSLTTVATPSTMPPASTAPLRRVVVVMPLGEQRGGGELMVLHLIQAGRNRGIEWTVVFLQEGPMPQQVRDYGVEAVVIRSGKMRNVPRLLWTAKKIADLAKAKNADLILGWMGTGQLYGGVASLLSGIPAAWYQLGIPLDQSVIDRIATRLPGRLVMTCSAFSALAQAKIAPHRPMRPVHPGVELERFDPAKLPSPADARRQLNLPPTGPIIGIVGRLQRWKGMHTLLEAFPTIRVRYPDAHLVIVGGVHDFEPEYATLLEKMIAEGGLADQVIMAGLQKDVPLWMQAMDIIVHASENEPFGIVVIEAMALGKPVVAADSGGPTEIITPGVHGFLTPYGDAVALAKAILQYLDEPALAQRMGEAARLRAQDFATTAYAGKVIACCQEAIAGNVAPSGADAAP